jgi:hypothetical protein
MRTRRNGDFTMTKPARIVDAHQHPFWHNRDDHGLVRDLDDHGIAYAWLLTWEIPPDTHDPATYPKGPIPAHGRLYRLFDTCPNLYGDLSANSGRNALSRDPANGRAFLLRYADRLLFARDNYGQDLHQFLQTLDLPQDVAEKIYFRNAEGLVPAGR